MPDVLGKNSKISLKFFKKLKKFPYILSVSDSLHRADNLRKLFVPADTFYTESVGCSDYRRNLLLHHL